MISLQKVLEDTAWRYAQGSEQIKALAAALVSAINKELHPEGIACPSCHAPDAMTPCTVVDDEEVLYQCDTCFYAASEKELACQ